MRLECPGPRMNFTPLNVTFAILGISLLVIVHEAGHFLAARAFGMRVLRFSIGLGPAIWKHKPKDSAVGMATAMGATLLTIEQYRALQELGEFDTKTSSWLRTPSEIRALGGAIFGDCRYQTVFVYHNGAESYYAARGFRCSLGV